MQRYPTRTSAKIKWMAELKTKPTDADVQTFLAGITDEQKRKDAATICNLMQEVTGEQPKMWGSSIIGFGRYRYKYKSGRQGEWMVAGFSPRKNALTLYLMSSYEFKDFEKELAELGKHKTSKGCLYINKLVDVDENVLRDIIKRSVDRVKSGEVLL